MKGIQAGVSASVVFAVVVVVVDVVVDVVADNDAEDVTGVGGGEVVTSAKVLFSPVQSLPPLQSLKQDKRQR